MTMLKFYLTMLGYVFATVIVLAVIVFGLYKLYRKIKDPGSRFGISKDSYQKGAFYAETSLEYERLISDRSMLLMFSIYNKLSAVSQSLKFLFSYGDDHSIVLVHRCGVYVFGICDDDGKIKGTDSSLTWNVIKDEDEKEIRNPIPWILDIRRELSETMGAPIKMVHGVIVFGDRAKMITNMLSCPKDKCILLSYRDLSAFIRSEFNKDAVFTDDEFAALCSMVRKGAMNRISEEEQISDVCTMPTVTNIGEEIKRERSAVVSQIVCRNGLMANNSMYYRRTGTDVRIATLDFANREEAQDYELTSIMRLFVGGQAFFVNESFLPSINMALPAMYVCPSGIIMIQTIHANGFVSGSRTSECWNVTSNDNETVEIDNLAYKKRVWERLLSKKTGVDKEYFYLIVILDGGLEVSQRTLKCDEKIYFTYMNGGINQALAEIFGDYQIRIPLEKIPILEAELCYGNRIAKRMEVSA